MKPLLLSFMFLFVTQNSLSQEKKTHSFFEISTRFTFNVNEDFTFDPDDDETFLEASAAFLRLGIGYMFGDLFSASIHAGYDYHPIHAIHAFPTYAKLRYNLWSDIEDSFFIQYGRGKMWRPSSRFADGDYYNLGFGWELKRQHRWKPTILFTYHRKKIKGFRDSGNLHSVSLGFGFRFF